MNRRAARGVRGLMAAAVAVAAQAIGGMPAARAADGVFEIPVIESLTGSGAFLGTQEHDALVILEKSVNKSGGIHGQPIRFAFHDDQSNPQVAVQITSGIVAEQPPVIIGSSLVSACNAMGPLVKGGPVMYCHSAGIHPPAGGYVFTSSVSTLDQAHALIRYFRMKGWTRLALATSTDATGQDADRGFDALLANPENADIKLVERVHFNINDVSVAAQMEHVRAAGPQAFIVWSTGSPAGTIFRGLVQAGITLPVGTTGGNMTYEQMKQFAAFLPKELYLPSSLWPVAQKGRVPLDAEVERLQKEFFAAYAEAGKTPDEGSVLAWDPGLIIVEALRKLPPGATAQQLRDTLLHLKGQPGIDGIYDYEKTPQRGLSLDETLVTRWMPEAGLWDVVSQPTGIPLGATTAVAH